MNTAIYPGSFDPITYGHLSIIKRAMPIFDKIYVAIANNSAKKYLFDTYDRMTLIRKSINSPISGLAYLAPAIDKIDIVILPEDKLLVDYAFEKSIGTIIRGLRAVSDFDYELLIASTNRKLQPEIDTIFLMAEENHLFISSTIVKEVAKYSKNLDKFVPNIVAEELYKKFGR